jgi:hypothetical protein
VALDPPGRAFAVVSGVAEISARTRVGLESFGKAQFQSHGSEHGLTNVRRADKVQRMIPSGGHDNGPLAHFLPLDYRCCIMAIRGSFRATGD